MVLKVIFVFDKSFQFWLHVLRFFFFPITRAKRNKGINQHFTGELKETMREYLFIYSFIWHVYLLSIYCMAGILPGDTLLSRTPCKAKFSSRWSSSRGNEKLIKKYKWADRGRWGKGEGQGAGEGDWEIPWIHVVGDFWMNCEEQPVKVQELRWNEPLGGHSV